MIEKKEGQVKVTVVDLDRMQAITELAHAINMLAQALSATPLVQITDCYFKGPEVGVSIDTVTVRTVDEVADWEGIDEPQSGAAD